MLSMFSGYKTYICGAVIICAGVLHVFGIIDSMVFESVLSLCGGAGLLSLRSGLKTDVKDTFEKVKDAIGNLKESNK